MGYYVWMGVLTIGYLAAWARAILAVIEVIKFCKDVYVQPSFATYLCELLDDDYLKPFLVIHVVVLFFVSLVLH